MTGTRSRSDAVAPFDLQSFAKAWVAALAVSGIDGFDPQDPGNRTGLAAMVGLLDASASGGLDHALALLQAANDLRPDALGRQAGVEAALLDLRHTFTDAPDPWSRRIGFSVSAVQAASYLSHIPHAHRELAVEAAKAFVDRQDGLLSGRRGGQPRHVDI